MHQTKSCIFNSRKIKKAQSEKSKRAARMNGLLKAWLAYFAIHIPISVLIDFQAVLPREWYPTQLRWLVEEWYFEHFQDFLMKSPPVWFRSLVWAELLVQLPFFFYAVPAIAYRWRSFSWAAFAYSAHLLTVMVPIIAEVASSPLAPVFKWRLCLVYGLWVAMPLWIFLYTWLRDPFAPSSSPSRPNHPFSPSIKRD